MSDIENNLLVCINGDCAKLPSKAFSEDAGYDIYSCQKIELLPGSTKIVSVGFSTRIPQPEHLNRLGIYCYGKIESRSGLASKGIFTTGGIIDPKYTGDIGAIINNLSSEPFKIDIGDKIAQFIVHLRYEGEKIMFVSELPKTERGSSGFGSTGTK
jgi:dUTP pyrophosphatase